jgi:hypothetical protein
MGDDRPIPNYLFTQTSYSPHLLAIQRAPQKGLQTGFREF